mmetsp:Transcript_29023/g.21591  ORF Transcript_29023/g.21591 Transcript_29023/m.21591 type:complete len:156 (-) Transcript_29023:290-757(-)
MLYSCSGLLKEEMLGAHFSFEVENEGVVEGHVVSVAAEDDEEGPEDDSSVPVPRCWPLPFRFPVVVRIKCTVQDAGLVHSVAHIHGALGMHWAVMLAVFAPFHLGVVVVERLICVLYYERVHHRNRSRSSQCQILPHCCRRSLLVSGVVVVHGDG